MAAQARRGRRRRYASAEPRAGPRLRPEAVEIRQQTAEEPAAPAKTRRKATPNKNRVPLEESDGNSCGAGAAKKLCRQREPAPRAGAKQLELIHLLRSAAATADPEKSARGPSWWRTFRQPAHPLRTAVHRAVCPSPATPTPTGAKGAHKVSARAPKGRKKCLLGRQRGAQSRQQPPAAAKYYT